MLLFIYKGGFMETIEKLVNKIVDLGIQLLIALIVVTIGFKLIKIIENKLKKENKFAKLDSSVKGFVISLLSISLKILLLVVAASIIGIPTTSFITVIGSCGVAIGLALQGGLSNLAGGLMLLIFKPFQVGDYIESNGKEGSVKAITMFYTIITTADNKEIQLPNGNLLNSEIVNYSANDERRVDLEFSVAYDTKIEKVKDVLNEVIDKSEYVLQNKDRTVRLFKQADSSLVFAVKVWVKREDYWNTYFQLQENVKEAFDKNKIEIPFPQIDVHQK